MVIEKIEATGKYVVLKGVLQQTKNVENDNGVVDVSQQTAATVKNTAGESYSLIVDSVGSLVELDKYNFKVGDEVIPNNYDLQWTEDDAHNVYAMCQAESIKAVVTAKR